MNTAKKMSGFTLVELIIVVAIIGIITTIAVPSYNSSVMRSSRETAQTELLQLAALQEKIYLNSNGYSTNTNIVTAAYTGQATGGLGWTSGTSTDKKYTYTCAAADCTTSAYTLTATPVSTKGQANDGTLTINSAGQRAWIKGGVTTAW